VGILPSPRATVSDYRRISRTGDVSSSRAAFSLTRCAYRSDTQVLHAVAGSQAGHAKARVRGGERRGNGRGSESTSDVGQRSLAIADDVDHGASLRCNWLSVKAWTLAIEGSDRPEFVSDGFLSLAQTIRTRVDRVCRGGLVEGAGGNGSGERVSMADGVAVGDGESGGDFE
jgi:hypothetical protein